MLDLPQEIVCAILAKLYYRNPPFSAPDYSTLCACSLVNSLWTDPAQTLLFRRITSDVVLSFTQFLAKYPDSRLLSHVRTVHITLSGSFTAFVSILEHCHGLYELTIAANGLFSLGPQSMARIATVQRSIRALRLMECSVQSPLLYQLLELFPQVQFLTIGVEIVASPPAWMPNFQLYELTLHRTPSSEVLTWLISSSHSSLRVLELRDLPSSSTSSNLAPCCPHIQSLRLMRYNTQTAAILKQCSNLTELVLLNVPTLVSLPALPPSLEHFTLFIQTYSTGIDMGPIVAVVDTLPRLRSLNLLGNPQEDQTTTLQAACDAKGVTMWSTPDKIWITEDPVIARFPRRLSVSNFYLMK
ncbi:hypothetical protein FB45DRAFT_783960 [Roridomyces roridus]|uniref:F-box domain-containing protein n=1 Tax=Roridomyces roridus TaxID=1738132 RepID=A0AAD7CB58_9AGAR|nr:hypothetical protein FB45DRAFT_783960 [Roridomyces roridus]